MFVRIQGRLDNAQLEKLGGGKKYYEVIKEEVANIKAHLEEKSLGKKVKLLNKSTDYNELDNTTIHAFIIIEGLHCFFGSNPISTQQGQDDIINNMNDFLKTNKVFAVNLTHLQPNGIGNHSFGIKLFSDVLFEPKECGLNKPIADKLIKYLYDKNILIDIKHLSVKSREDLYAYRDGKAVPPLICTHAGVTGIEKAEAQHYVTTHQFSNNINKVEYYKKLGHLAGTSFNISSINLFDEDIKMIFRTNGLIGVSLDRRIIGYTEFFDIDEVTDMEYLSQGEYNNLFGANPDFSLGDREIFTFETLTTEDKQNEIILDLRFFFNQIFHILKVAEEMGVRDQAAKSICIGSDLDGLIDALRCCESADAFPKFYNLAKENFANYAEEAEVNITGIEQLMEWIFFKNGRNFVLANIDKIKQA